MEYFTSDVYESLSKLLEDGAELVDGWTDASQWVFKPGSSAAIETANTEVRRDGSAWGERPVHTVYQLGQMATKLTVEIARCSVLVVRSARPAVGAEVLTRSSLEAASIVWWLFEPGLTARQRVCRMQLLRRNNAKEFGAALKAVGDCRSVGNWETIDSVEAYSDELGLKPFGNKGDELEGEVRLRYTARVKRLTDDIGFQGGYNLYSGVAHAELAGLWRLLSKVGTLEDGTPIYNAVPDTRATLSVVQGNLFAMMGCMTRIVDLFGWTAPGAAEEVGAWIKYVNCELSRLDDIMR